MNSLFPRCQIVPRSDFETAFQIDGVERLRWNCNPQATRPYFWPVIGPSGHMLTRFGHPGAPDHDHHKSVWFAHFKVLGINFWGDNGPARVRQENWLVYDDADDRAAMAVRLGWYDGHDPQSLLEQTLIAIVRPGENREFSLDLQSTFTPRAESLEFQQTNFGFLAVRVAKSISAFFGGGTISDSEGREGEPAIFGKQARWMDYSGPVADDVVEGITFFDHPDNPGYPTGWHVRKDGWMGASACMYAPLMTTREQPLTLRYRLHIHRGTHDHERATVQAAAFADTPLLKVQRSPQPHRHNEIVEA